MFSVAEYTLLARQMTESLKGKTITRGELGNSPHKFVWYNRTPEEFGDLTEGKALGETRVMAYWLLTSLEPGFVLGLGAFGGKLLYHQPGAKLPKKYHLYIPFTDGSFLTSATQMWGVYKLYADGEEQNEPDIRDMRAIPSTPDFTLDYFEKLVDEAIAEKKRTVKSLLTQFSTIPGLGNGLAQDIMFNARLHPRRDMAELTHAERETLYHAIVDTVQAVMAQGGRYNLLNLYGEPGSYQTLMDRNALKRPCPVCGGTVTKFAYLGGACYVCPTCQPL